MRCVTVLVLLLAAAAARADTHVGAREQPMGLRVHRGDTVFRFETGLATPLRVTAVGGGGAALPDEWVRVAEPADAPARPDLAFCFAVFTDTRATAQPAACLGDPAVCAASAASELRRCAPAASRAPQGFRVAAAAPAYYYFASPAAADAVAIHTAPAPVDYAAAPRWRLDPASSPTSVIVGLAPHTGVQDGGGEGGGAPPEGGGAPPGDVYVGPRLVGAMAEGGLTLTGVAPLLALWDTVTVVAPPAITEIAVHAVMDPLDVSVSAAMRPPRAEVLVGAPVIRPALPANSWLAVYTLRDGERVADSAVFSPAAGGAPRALRLAEGRCDALHTLEVSIVGTAGNLLHTQARAVSPAMYCAARALSPDCHCGGAPARRRDGAEPPTDVVFGDIHVPGQGSTGCAAVRVGDGLVVAGVAGAGGCAVVGAPVGTYLVEAPPGVPIRRVHVCVQEQPSLFAQQDGAGDAVAYIYATSGLQCPPGAPEIEPEMHWMYSTDGAAAVYSPLVDAEPLLWYPDPGHYRAVFDAVAEGAGDQFGSVSSPVFHVTTSPNALAAPRGCVGYTASLSRAVGPLFATDHEAYATIVIGGGGAPPHPPAGSGSGSGGGGGGQSPPHMWAVSVGAQAAGAPAEWWEMPVDAAGVPEPFEFKLEAGVAYRVRLMRAPRLANATNLFAGEACYLEAGRIAARTPPTVHVLSPVDIVECGAADGSVVILFDVHSSDALAAPPTSAFPVAQLGEPELGEEGLEYRFALTGYRLGEPAGGLALLFDFGEGHTIVSNTLRHLIADRMYPPPVYVRVGLAPHTGVRDGGGKGGGAPPKCAREQMTVQLESAMSSRGAIRGLPLSARDAAGRPVNMIMKPRWDKDFLYIIHVPALPVGAPGAGVLDVEINFFSTPAVAAVCAGLRVTGAAPQFVDMGVGVEVVSAEQTPDHLMCAGKRLMRFTRPADMPEWIEYRAVDQADLGPVIDDAGTFAADARRGGRPVAVAAYSTANGARLCTVDVVLPADEWLPVRPTVSVGSYVEPPCARAGEREAVAELALDSPFADTLILYGLDAATANPPPPVRGGNRLLYTDLPLGRYASEVTATTRGVTCYTVTHHFLGNDPAQYELVDPAHTSAGRAEMPCPADLYGTASAWQAYLDVAFSPYFRARWLGASGAAVATAITHADNAALLSSGAPPAPANAPKLFPAIDRVVASYRLPMPGRYVPQVSVTDSAQTCLFFLPAYEVSEPAFDPEAFRLSVAKYPACADSTDGIAAIVYPVAGARGVTALLTACVPLDPDLPPAACVHDAVVETVAPGRIEVRHIPFATALTFQFEVAGACRFTQTYHLLPPRGAYPQLTHLVYEPLCAPAHRIVAHGPDGPLAPTPGLVFSWGGGGLAAPTGVLELPYEEIAGVEFELELTYAPPFEAGGLGVCRGGAATLRVDAADVLAPPRVVIDPPIAGHGSHSLPLFCPGGADAVLYASLAPPLRPEIDTVAWAQDAAVATSQLIHNERVMAHDLPPGEYSLNYTRRSPATGAACSAVATVVVPEKRHYIAQGHIAVRSAACAGGVASARLESGAEHRGCGVAPEFGAFSASMVPSAQRRYIKDSGFGSAALTDVPDGATISIRVPYSEAYVYHSGEFCSRPLALHFPKTAPLPVFVSTPILDCCAATITLAIHVSPLHARTTITWENGGLVPLHPPPSTLSRRSTGGGEGGSAPPTPREFVVMVEDRDRGCVQRASVDLRARLGADGLLFRYAAEPARQTLCAGELARAVRVVRRNVVTGREDAVAELDVAAIVALPSREVPGEWPARAYTYRPPAELRNLGCPAHQDEVEFVVVELPPPVVSGLRAVEGDDTHAEQMRIVADVAAGGEGGAVTGVASRTTPQVLPFQYAVGGRSCTVWIDTAPLVAALVDPAVAAAPVMVVQGRDLPAPAAGYRSLVVGVRGVDSAPVPVDVYARNVNTMTAVVVSTFLAGRSGRGGAPHSTHTVLLARSARSAYWTHFAQTELTPGLTHELALVDTTTNAAVRRDGAPLAPLRITVDAGRAMAVECSVVAHPDTPHGLNGRARVQITGGVAPFVLIWQDQDAAAGGTGRDHVREGMGAGHYVVSVYQASQPITPATRASCAVTLSALAPFEVHGAALLAVAGCGPSTVATARVLVSPAGAVRALGWWNAADAEPRIDSCADSRVAALAAPAAVRAVLPPGEWHFAACSESGAIVTTAGKAPFVVRPSEPTLVVDKVFPGEVCTDDDGRVAYKAYPRIILGGGLTPPSPPSGVVIRDVGRGGSIVPATIEDSAHVLRGGEGGFAPPAPPMGVHRLEVAEEFAGCAVAVEVSVADTGRNDCGSCLAEDFSCHGCDGVPNSGAVRDRCGVCGGNSECATDCVSRISAPEAPLHERGGDPTIVFDEIPYCASHGLPYGLQGPLTLPADPARDGTLGGRDLEISTVPLLSRQIIDIGDTVLVARTVVLRRVVIPEGTRLAISAADVLIEDSVVEGAVVVQLPACEPRPDDLPRVVIRGSKLLGMPTIALPRTLGPCYPVQVQRASRRRAGDGEGDGDGGLAMEDCEFGAGVTLVGPEGRLVVSVNDTTTIKYGFGNGTIEVDPNSGITEIDVTAVEFPVPRYTLACQLFVDIPNLKLVVDGDDKWTKDNLRANKFCDGALDNDSASKPDMFAFILSMSSYGVLIVVVFMALFAAWSGYNSSRRAPQRSPFRRL